MGKPGAFLEHGRCAHSLRPVQERSRDFDELYEPVPEERTREQASRCMACGVAFCQVGAPFGTARPSGCPLHNLIPEWNDLVWRGQWEQAAERLGVWRLTGCTVYVTLEPCVMCAGLMHQARVDRCVYGAADPKAGALGTLYAVNADERLNHTFEAVSGVLGDECAELLRSFFARKRKKRMESK